jgi:hypothetical protein
MTQDDIIRMAREAGFPITNHLSGRQDIAGQSVARFRRFASLVAAAEREACARIAETTICDTHLPTGVQIYGSKAAAAIRARSNA